MIASVNCWSDGLVPVEAIAHGLERCAHLAAYLDDGTRAIRIHRYVREHAKYKLRRSKLNCYAEDMKMAAMKKRYGLGRSWLILAFVSVFFFNLRKSLQFSS